jgi:hypothetical protein
LRYGIVAFALICAGTCVSQVRAQAVALVFADTHALAVDATTLDIRNADTSPATYPYVTQQAPVPYDQAIRAWAAQRFMLTGGSVNTLRVTMRKGSITEKLLPVSHGISAWFKKEQGADYTGTLEVDVAIVDPNGKVLTSADGNSFATQSVREDATSADRQNAWLAIVKMTFDNLDNDLIPRMRDAMHEYVH